uniref:Uncharacterized protein n=1 Tax=Oryza glumipatula TaxID=40148 RepID=A0A0D9YCA0_9ORYZ
MAGHIYTPTVIMGKLLSDNGSQEFGDFKLVIHRMLSMYLYEKTILKRVSGSPNTLFRGASRCCHHYPHASPVVCLYPRASGSIAAVDQEAKASLMVGIGNGTTSTPIRSESVTMVQSISQIGRMASKWIDGIALSNN